MDRFWVILLSAAWLFLGITGIFPGQGTALAAGAGAGAGAGKVVYTVPVSGTIEPGIASFIRRAMDKAAKDGAGGIILAIDTFGGRIDAATEIRTAILNSKVPVIAYVENQAFSAGALITIAAEKIAMKPGSSLGAAEPRPAEEKIISAWRAELEATAEARSRNPAVAAAMADRDVEIPGIKEKGKILSLTARQAQKLGYADYLVGSREELLDRLGLTGARVMELKPGTAETVARFATNPFVSPILLTIGIAGLVLEALTVGWGIAGTVGLASLGLFFGGHMLAGLTGWESVLLFLLGITALVLEIFLIPGFGVAGIIGIALIVWSIFLTSINATQAIISLVFALVGTILFLALTWRLMTKRNLWNRIILGEKQQKAAGYSAPKRDLANFAGKTGKALTPLRPAGTAEIDGIRLDVVTEGDFIPAQAPVQVVYVEGARVVVRKLDQQ